MTEETCSFFIIDMYQPPLLKKIFSVIEVLLDEPEGAKLSHISKRTGINKGTLYGILLAMEKEGYVKKNRETKTYSISKELIRLAKKILKKADLPGIARPYLERLSQKFGETVFLGIREGEYITVIDVIEATRPYKITSPPGTKLPITAGATGKVALSFLSNEEVREIIKKMGLRKYTEKTISDERAFLAELERVRSSMYAIEFEEYIKGVWACAAPVLSDGSLLALVWIVGFTSSLKEEKTKEVIEEIKKTVRSISLAYESFWKEEERNNG